MEKYPIRNILPKANYLWRGRSGSKKDDGSLFYVVFISPNTHTFALCQKSQKNCLKQRKKQQEMLASGWWYSFYYSMSSFLSLISTYCHRCIYWFESEVIPQSSLLLLLVSSLFILYQPDSSSLRNSSTRVPSYWFCSFIHYHSL